MHEEQSLSEGKEHGYLGIEVSKISNWGWHMQDLLDYNTLVG